MVFVLSLRVRARFGLHPRGQSVSPALALTTSPVAAKQTGLITATLGAAGVSRGIIINVGSGFCQ